MKALAQYEAWFVTGSQHLYGEETLKQVAKHSQEIAKSFDENPGIPVRIVFKPVLTTPDAIYQLAQEANSTPACIGLITWMHTFSPAKMWIAGLKMLNKPILHLHTQYNRDIPWSDIDMDFMNLNQAAHGDREYGFIGTRMRIARKVVVGHWSDANVQQRVNIWTRVAAAWADSQSMKVARIGDNMREVAVTEGDKVGAQIRFGYSVNGYGLGDVAKRVNEVTDAEIDALTAVYDAEYTLSASLRKGGDQHASLREAARIELGMRAFLTDGGFKAYTDTFENLHGLAQLPGIATQRLMADGYGFGAEGDWKTAALVRSMKVMGLGLEGGNSFMEDYTYHFEPGNNLVLGSHMLEICPSIANGKASCEVHPLGIGGKADPVRLVFNSGAAQALNASVVDLGNRFRLLVNEVEGIEPSYDLPKLPVARVLWKAKPSLSVAAQAWILAGGAHHTCYTQSLTPEYLEDFAEIAGIEYVLINDDTNMLAFKQDLRNNEIYYHFGLGLRG